MAEVRELYKMAAADTRPAARSYWLNSAFLAGRQWIFYDETTDQPKDMAGDGRVRMVVNRMITNHRTIIANLTQRELAFDVFPNMADDASLQASYIATEVLYALASEHNWERKREEVATAILKGGVAAIALDWDESRNDSVESVLSIAEFTVEPGTRDPEHSRWWIKAQMLNPLEVKAIYDMKETPVADVTQGLNPIQSSMLAAHLNADTLNPLTLVLTYYERPNKINPDGKVLVEINNQIVEDMPWPFPFRDRLNFVLGVETVVENRWWGDTVYNYAREPQVGLNTAKSNLSEHLRDASVARMLIPHSAIRVMEALNDVPGNMYPYPDGLQAPKWLEPAQLPAWLQNLQIEYKSDIDDIMGVHDVSRGVAPANLESGTAISILAEMDGTPVGRIIKEIGGLFSRLARMELQLHEQMTKTKRFTVIDTGEGPLGVAWTGKDIDGQHNARVPLEAIVPRSRAAQMELANTMLEMGVIKSPVEYMRFAEMPNRRHLIDVLEPNIAKAAREHSAMAQGRIVLPAMFDDHTKHIVEHNNFRLTVAYERLAPEDQAKVDEHIVAHERLAGEAMGTMVSKMEANPALAEVPTANADPVPSVLPGEEVSSPAAPPSPPPPELDPDDPAAAEAMMADMEGMFG